MSEPNWQPGPTSARVLGLLRIGLGYTWLGMLAGKAFLVFEPAVRWKAVSFGHLLSGPPSQNTSALLYLLTVAAALCLTAGLATRISGPVTVVAGTSFLTFGYCYGKVFHTENLLIATTLCMSFSNWGQAFSLDSLRRQKGEGKKVEAWGLWLVTALLASFYLGSSIMKVSHGFLAPGTLTGFLKARLLFGGEWLKPLTPWVLSHPFLCELGAWGAVLLEASFWLGLRSTSFRVAAYCIALAFHSTLTALAALGFVIMKQVLLVLLLANLLLFLSEKWPRLSRWVHEIPTQPAGWKIQSTALLATGIFVALATAISGQNLGYLVDGTSSLLQTFILSYGNQKSGLVALMATMTAGWVLWLDRPKSSRA